MKLSITQPYFFPYLGLFQLIYATDKMVILDTVAYKKRSWMNRNRILHPTQNDAFIYVTLPVCHASFTPICDVEIDTSQPWKAKIEGQITAYAKKAPYYQETRRLIHDCLDSKESNYAAFTMHCIQRICDYLGLKLTFCYASKLDITLPPIEAPDEWSLFISQALHAQEYINMPKGVSIFHEEKFIEHNIKLSFLNPRLSAYPQRKKAPFMSHLSIIDVLMWNSKERVLEMIQNDFDILSFQEMHQ